MEKKENLAAIIADNLVYYRKKAQLTQSELAEKLNYSDKSVSPRYPVRKGLLG